MRKSLVSSKWPAGVVWRLALFGGLAWALAACGTEAGDATVAAPPEVRAPDETREVQSDVTLALVAEEVTEQRVKVSLQYQRRETLEGPRAMEIFLSYDGALSFTSGQALAAAEVAGKEVVVQEREPGLLRVILYATSNLNRLDSGGLVELTFQRPSQGGGGTVDFVTERTKLAPTESMQGMMFSDRLVVGGP